MRCRRLSRSLALSLGFAFGGFGPRLGIGFGFAILSFSDYLGFAKIGLFGALSIFVALLCDLFLIPAMIVLFRPTFDIENVDNSFKFQVSGK